MVPNMLADTLKARSIGADLGTQGPLCSPPGKTPCILSMQPNSIYMFRFCRISGEVLLTDKKAISSFQPNAEFVRSYARVSDMPGSESPEFALLGRSNVGKSSFLNHVFARKALARVSKKPGKTRLANVYKTADGSFWVDLPGYGYATAGREEKKGWSALIDRYVRDRTCLYGIVWLLDVRHPGLRMDQQAGEWLESIALPVLPVMTKCDKLSRNNVQKNVAAFRRLFRFVEEPILFTTTETRTREQFWNRFFEWKARIVS